jgi:hypothetical protein
MSYLDTPKGRADLLRQRADELRKLADSIESGGEFAPNNLERRIELMNAEAARWRASFMKATDKPRGYAKRGRALAGSWKC